MTPLAIVLGVGFIVLAAATTALVLRWAWAGRHDPADADLSSIEQWEKARASLARREAKP